MQSPGSNEKTDTTVRIDNSGSNYDALGNSNTDTADMRKLGVRQETKVQHT